MRRSQWSMVSGQWFVFKPYKKIFLFLISHFLFLISSAQSVSASLDRDKILLGEQVTLQLNLTGVNPLSYFVTNWPQVTDTLNHIEVLKRSAIDTIEVNGTNSYQQNFTLTGFDSGRWQLGPFNFTLQDKGTGKQTTIASPAIYLTILPVDVSALKNYHPLKDVIEVNTSFNWLPVIGIAAIILIIAIIIIILKRRKKKINTLPKTILPGTPIQRAVQKLMQLQHQSLQHESAIKKFHSDIDIICREYFEETLHIKAMQETTNELFSRMNIFIHDTALRSKLHEIFELNSSVKFARYMPAETQSKTILQEVIFSLEKIDALNQQSPNNVKSMA